MGTTANHISFLPRVGAEARAGGYHEAVWHGDISNSQEDAVVGERVSSAGVGGVISVAGFAFVFAISRLQHR